MKLLPDENVGKALLLGLRRRHPGVDVVRVVNVGLGGRSGRGSGVGRILEDLEPPLAATQSGELENTILYLPLLSLGTTLGTQVRDLLLGGGGSQRVSALSMVYGVSASAEALVSIVGLPTRLHGDHHHNGILAHGEALEPLGHDGVLEMGIPTPSCAN